MTSNERLVIRTARPGDVGRLVELLIAGSLSGDEDDADLAPYQRALEQIAADPDSDLLVAEAGEEVVGFCQLITFRHLQCRGGLCAEIESVHVDQHRRSEGIGSLLLAEAVSRARQAGCYRVQLTSDRRRQDAHRFYQRQGFQPTHQGFKLRLDRPR